MTRTAYLLVLHTTFLALFVPVCIAVVAGCSLVKATFTWFSDRASRRFVRRVLSQPQNPPSQPSPRADSRAKKTLPTLPPPATQPPSSSQAEHKLTQAAHAALCLTQSRLRRKLRPSARSL